MRIEEYLTAEVDAGAFPGATFAFGDARRCFAGAVGWTDDTRSQATTTDLIYDLASMSKVMATTSVAMRLWQEGFFDLDDPVQKWLPEASWPGVTVRMLLTHSSGLPAHERLDLLARDDADAWGRLLAWPLAAKPDAQQTYSCLGFLILGRLLTRVLMGGKFDVATERERRDMFRVFVDMNILRPLQMDATGFCPKERFPLEAIAPTEGKLWGDVHDENARFLGGIAGNAGLFGPVGDVATFAQAFLRGGEGVVDRPTIDRFTARWSERPQDSRALGWDTKSPIGSSAGSKFGPRSYGHTGFTGTSLWIDPEAGIFGVLLTNRVHPTREREGILSVRPAFYDLVFDALSG